MAAPGSRAEGLLLGTGGAAVTSTYGLGLQTATSPRPTDSGKWKLGCLGPASCFPRMPYACHPVAALQEGGHQLRLPTRAPGHSSAPPRVKWGPGPGRYAEGFAEHMSADGKGPWDTHQKAIWPQVFFTKPGKIFRCCTGSLS